MVKNCHQEETKMLVAPSSVVLHMTAHLLVPFRRGQGVVDRGVGKEQEVGLLCLLLETSQEILKETQKQNK